MKINAKYRISLTGTPLQNNLNEYHTMVNWIRPGFLGNWNKFEKHYADPINRSLHVSRYSRVFIHQYFTKQ